MSLRARDATILLLQTLGLSQQEIAERCNTTRSAVAGVIYRSRSPLEPKPKRPNYRLNPHHVRSYVDPETFRKIQKLATANNWTITETIRCLITWSIDDATDHSD